MAGVRSAIVVRVETFGDDVLELEPPVIEAFVAEAALPERGPRP